MSKPTPLTTHQLGMLAQMAGDSGNAVVRIGSEPLRSLLAEVHAHRDAATSAAAVAGKSYEDLAPDFDLKSGEDVKRAIDRHRKTRAGK